MIPPQIGIWNQSLWFFLLSFHSRQKLVWRLLLGDPSQQPPVNYVCCTYSMTIFRTCTHSFLFLCTYLRGFAASSKYTPPSPRASSSYPPPRQSKSIASVAAAVLRITRRICVRADSDLSCPPYFVLDRAAIGSWESSFRHRRPPETNPPSIVSSPFVAWWPPSL